MNRLSLLLLFAVVSVGCKKPMHSPAFLEASGTYTNVLAVDGDDGYFGARMDKVVTLLAAVPADSLDATAAAELAAKITSERARIAAERQAAMVAAKQPLEVPFPPAVAVAPPVEAPAGPPPEAPRVDEFARGAAWGPVQQKYSACLSPRESVAVSNKQDGGSLGTATLWEASSTPDCAKKLPMLAQSVVVVQDGKITSLAAKADIKVITLTTTEILDAGPPPAPAPRPAPVEADSGA